MWPSLKHCIATYHAHLARSHYQRRHYALCLNHLVSLQRWQPEFAQKPIYMGYLAMCHYQLKDWNHLTEEVERALFLLRRHIKEDKDALLLWEELKSHLADLRFIDQSHVDHRKQAFKA